MTPPDDAPDKPTRDSGSGGGIARALDPDYEAILAAVTETVRGRWFLDEYARRNRTADTRALLSVLRRIEKSMQPAPAAPAILPGLRDAVAGFADAIARIRVEIAAIPRYGDEGAIRRNADDIDFDAETNSGKATMNQIHESAERIQEVVWSLREREVSVELCDVLDRHAVNIQGACRMGNATLKAMSAMGRALRHLEDGLAALQDQLSTEAEFVDGEAEAIELSPEEAALGRFLEDIEMVDIEEVNWESHDLELELDSDSEIELADDIPELDPGDDSVEIDVEPVAGDLSEAPDPEPEPESETEREPGPELKSPVKSETETETEPEAEPVLVASGQPDAAEPSSDMPETRDVASVVADAAAESTSPAPAVTKPEASQPPVPIKPAAEPALPAKTRSEPPADLTGLTFDQKMILFS